MNKQTETERLLEAVLEKQELDENTRALLIRLGRKTIQDFEDFEDDWKRIKEDMKRGAKITDHKFSL